VQPASLFSIIQFWDQGDSVSHCVAIILICMSVTTWVVMAVKAINLFCQRRFAKKVEAFWHAVGLDQGMLALGPVARNHFYVLARRGHEALVHIKQSRCDNTVDMPAQLHDSLNVSDWVTRGLQQSIDTSAASLQTGLGLLGSIGSTAPFIGLFGTVWGIYHALIGLSAPQGAKTQASIALVAGPIGEALIMTALGLAVAIPAVLAYNGLTRGNKGIISALNRFAHDLHAYLVTGTRIDHRSR
jgi:biopolymer transport protein ExbB